MVDAAPPEISRVLLTSEHADSTSVHRRAATTTTELGEWEAVLVSGRPGEPALGVAIAVPALGAEQTSLLTQLGQWTHGGFFTRKIDFSPDRDLVAAVQP